jgi:hypothetical protein
MTTHTVHFILWSIMVDVQTVVGIRFREYTFCEYRYYTFCEYTFREYTFYTHLKQCFGSALTLCGSGFSFLSKYGSGSSFVN